MANKLTKLNKKLRFFRESHGAKKMPNGLTRSQAG